MKPGLQSILSRVREVFFGSKGQWKMTGEVDVWFRLLLLNGIAGTGIRTREVLLRRSGPLINLSVMRD